MYTKKGGNKNMQELKEIPMDQKHKEEFIDIFNRTREDNGYEKMGKPYDQELSTDKCNIISCYVNFDPKSVSYGWISILFEKEGELYAFLICSHDANFGKLYPRLITDVSRIMAIGNDLFEEYKYSQNLGWNLPSLPYFNKSKLSKNSLELMMLVKSIRKYCKNHKFSKRFTKTDKQHTTWLHIRCCELES